MTNRRVEPYIPEVAPKFAEHRADYLLLMDGKREGSSCSWSNARIVPYEPISMSPAAVCLDYGQCVFEGMVISMLKDGTLVAYRGDDHMQRLNISAGIMDIPGVPVELQRACLEKLVEVNGNWFPQGHEGAVLYTRPKIMGIDDQVGVQPSKDYLYVLHLSTSGPYFAGGFKPIDLLLTKQFHRVPRGNNGQAKASAHYANSLQAQRLAKKLGCAQVLYLDATNELVMETGATNIAVCTKDGVLFTPSDHPEILRSITRRSVVENQNNIGLIADHRLMYLDDFLYRIETGFTKELICLGTAAVSSGVGRVLLLDDTLSFSEIDDIVQSDLPLSLLRTQTCHKYVVGDGSFGEIAQQLNHRLVEMRTGRRKVPDGWLMPVGKIRPVSV